MRKIAIILVAVMLLMAFAGCSEKVSDIAGSVADAAKAELEAQVKAALEEYKVTVVEVKTVAGKLNDEGGQVQFYCAALVQSDSEVMPQACADALDGVFQDTGVFSQYGSAVESSYLVHKNITFKHSDFSQENYYVIYAYMGDINLEKLTEKSA